MQSSNFDFSILYTKLSHKDLIKVLFDLINFDFNRSSKKKRFFLTKFVLVEQA